MTTDPIHLAVEALKRGDMSAAEELCSAVLKVDPNSIAALNLLGVVVRELGRVHEAVELFQLAIQSAPQVADSYSNLGAVLGQLGRFEEAAIALKHAVKLRPDLPGSHNNLGVLLEKSGRHGEAAEAYRNAIRLRPDSPVYHCNLGNAQRKALNHDGAIASYNQALRVAPDYVDAERGLAQIEQERGQMDRAEKRWRQYIRLRPTDAGAHSDLILSMNYNPRHTPQSILSETKRWAERHARFPETNGFDHKSARDLRRRLRVGYLSSGLKDHVVGRLLDPVLRHHDRNAFEVICYADVAKPDSSTQRYRATADQWHDVAQLDDRSLAELIRLHRIDILIETTGHFSGNRLRVMARRCAPIQVAGFGYCGTSGVPAIDYRLTDALSDPPGVTDRDHTESLWRLPSCVNCFAPDELFPEMTELPALSNPGVTFCCLNSAPKITDELVRVSSAILHQLPDSKLLLLRNSRDDYILSRFSRFEIGHGRLIIADRCPRFAYLQLYAKSDIALDTYPFNGDNTSLDAVVMGVPLVTRAGDRFASRRGLSHLMNLGYGDWIAANDEAYIDAAIKLASDLPRLATIRSQLRDQLRHLPLGDAIPYVRALEDAYREMWQRWCERNAK